MPAFINNPTLIGEAIVTALRGLSLMPAENVLRRKTPSLPPGKDPPAIVVVVSDAGAEGATEPLTATEKINRYPTLVVIITAAGGKALADDDTVREWRNAVEDEIDDRELVTFAGLPGFNRVITTGQAPFDGSVIPKDLNYSAQTFNVEMIETRAART